MKRSLATGLLVSLCCVGMVGCAVSSMQVPTAALGNPAWSVAGYRHKSVIDRDFKLGDSAVHDISRSNPAAGFAPRAIAASKSSTRSYSFELTTGGQAWQGACTDLTEPREHAVVGFGRFKNSLSCVCGVGASASVELSLVDGKGTLKLAAGELLQVAPVKLNERGKKEPETLGYSFTGARGVGALERTGSGRAWPPAGLDARASRELSCAYAALLLYQR